MGVCVQTPLNVMNRTTVKLSVSLKWLKYVSRELEHRKPIIFALGGTDSNVFLLSCVFNNVLRNTTLKG